MTDEDHYIGLIDFASSAELQDVKSLQTLLEQQWNLAIELDLSEGELHLRRDESR